MGIRGGSEFLFGNGDSHVLSSSNLGSIVSKKLILLCKCQGSRPYIECLSTSQFLKLGGLSSLPSSAGQYIPRLSGHEGLFASVREI